MTDLTGKQRVIKTLNHEPTDRIPWVPFAGVHAGKLIEVQAIDVLTDGEKLVKALLAVHNRYSPDGMPIYFDIQVEAEILGCELQWAKNAPPSVVSHPLAEGKRVPDALPTEASGRLPIILNAMRRLKSEIGSDVALFGLLTGLLTLAYHLRGPKLFYDISEAPDYLRALLSYTTQVAKTITDLYVAAGMDVIGVIEPVTSQVSPRTFTDFLSQNYHTLFNHIELKGAKSMLHICGNAEKIIEPMCQTGTNTISLDENVDFSAVKPITDRYNVVLQGNIPIVSCMLPGQPQDVMAYVVKMLQGLPDQHNLILSPGCDLPYDTPTENVAAAFDALCQRESLSIPADGPLG